MALVGHNGSGKTTLLRMAAGLLGGLFGVGGGLIIVPGLVGFAKMERRLAHGTSLAATLPIALASLITYLSHGNVDWPVALFLAIGAIAGAIVGTQLLRVIPKNVLIIIYNYDKWKFHSLLSFASGTGIQIINSVLPGCENTLISPL